VKGQRKHRFSFAPYFLLCDIVENESKFIYIFTFVHIAFFKKTMDYWRLKSLEPIPPNP